MPQAEMGSGWRKWCPRSVSGSSENRTETFSFKLELGRLLVVTWEKSSSGERGRSQIFQVWPRGRMGGWLV